MCTINYELVEIFAFLNNARDVIMSHFLFCTVKPYLGAVKSQETTYYFLYNRGKGLSSFLTPEYDFCNFGLKRLMLEESANILYIILNPHNIISPN
jgi:hypothetical protein